MQAPDSTVTLLSGARRVRIIGQGLTGSLLALGLKDRGIPFVVQDVLLPGAATPVAPGIVNPMAGRRFRPPDRITMLLAAMSTAMEQLEQHLGESFWKPCPILRMFSEPTQIDAFEKRLTDPRTRPFVDEQFAENAFPHLNDVFGSFLTRQGGWANLPRLRERMRDWLTEAGCLQPSPWEPGSEPEDPDEILVFCDGWRVADNPHWNFIPHNPAKGEMLIVRFRDELPRDRIYNQSCWVQPIEDDLWRVGATYSWSAFNSQASLEGARDLQQRLQLLTPIPFTVEDQVAGVRPIVEDYRPVIGRHPEITNWYILNAMGSKGVLQAPASVTCFLDHLLNSRGIPADWNLNRFL
jgi:glycine/D-amino acid oxidase-like deaminating enzyme